MVVNSAVSYGDNVAYRFYSDKNRVRRMYYCNVLVYGEAQLATPTDVQLSNDILSFSTVEDATNYDVFITAPDGTLEKLGDMNHLYEHEGKVIAVKRAYPYQVYNKILRMF